jgi:hypothetical protein
MNDTTKASSSLRLAAFLVSDATTSGTPCARPRANTFVGPSEPFAALACVAVAERILTELRPELAATRKRAAAPSTRNR